MRKERYEWGGSFSRKDLGNRYHAGVSRPDMEDGLPNKNAR
jgi:hypothetical protein